MTEIREDYESYRNASSLIGSHYYLLILDNVIYSVVSNTPRWQRFTTFSREQTGISKGRTRQSATNPREGIHHLLMVRHIELIQQPIEDIRFQMIGKSV